MIRLATLRAKSIGKPQSHILCCSALTIGSNMFYLIQGGQIVYKCTLNIVTINMSFVERQKGLSMSHIYIQLDPSTFQLVTSYSIQIQLSLSGTGREHIS
jgi:hypothetical protein